jgi:hypothetical protein
VHDQGAYMARFIIVLVFIGIAYWYWSGPHDYSAETSPVDDPKKNAQIIADCVEHGYSEQSDGYKGQGRSPEDICADENNLHKTYTGWHRR